MHNHEKLSSSDKNVSFLAISCFATVHFSIVRVYCGPVPLWLMNWRWCWFSSIGGVPAGRGGLPKLEDKKIPDFWEILQLSIILYNSYLSCWFVLLVMNFQVLVLGKPPPVRLHFVTA
jgi:hypothetical protein